MLNSEVGMSAEVENMTDEQRRRFLMVARSVEQLNECICSAVDTGLSIELQRALRHHHAGGYWGDIMTPRVVKRGWGGV